MDGIKDCWEPHNQLLMALPPSEYRHLVPYLEPIDLPLHQVLCEPCEKTEYVYFPIDAAISLVFTTREGSSVEIGLVGREGMVGIATILGGHSMLSSTVVQIAGKGLRIQASVLKSEFDRGGPLQYLLLRYIQAFFTQVSQQAVCNRLHNLEERLARWLLAVHDCVQKDTFVMTQEYIAEMLGSRRSGVTVAAGTLQKAGIIHYRRGNIKILDRCQLEAVSCECYNIIRSEYCRLLGS
jgi:CRP-like cAMP-binding protein